MLMQNRIDRGHSDARPVAQEVFSRASRRMRWSRSKCSTNNHFCLRFFLSCMKSKSIALGKARGESQSRHASTPSYGLECQRGEHPLCLKECSMRVRAANSVQTQGYRSVPKFLRALARCSNPAPRGTVTQERMRRRAGPVADRHRPTLGVARNPPIRCHRFPRRRGRLAVTALCTESRDYFFG
jgi:hypothetical protein